MVWLLLPLLAWADDECVGPIVADIYDAQDAFSEACCTTYDGGSGFHYCEWVDLAEGTGWRCREHPGAPEDCGTCYGTYEADLYDARDAYEGLCGQPWDPSSGLHLCEWDALGWLCWGPGPDGEPPGGPDDEPPEDDPPGACDQGLLDATPEELPPQPVDVALDEQGVLTWRQIPRGELVRQWNVFRDGAYVSTVAETRFTTAADPERVRWHVEAVHPDSGSYSWPSVPVLWAAAPVHPVDAPSVDAVPDFPDQVRTDELAGDWVVSWNEDFEGTSLDTTRWHFYEDPDHRDTAVQNTEHAHVADGRLRMDAVVNDEGVPEMSFLRTIEPNNGIGADDFVLDPTDGPVYLEASVRLDQARDVYHGWWAFWLFVNDVDSDGVQYRAYDMDSETGSEVDIFEYAPDVAVNGFNAAVFLAQEPDPDSPLEHVVRPEGTEGDFSLPDAAARFGIDLVDGRFHKLGLLYTPERMVFYLDGQPFWDLDDPDYITGQPRLGVQLTWEARDNPDGTGSFNPSVRYDDCGNLLDFATGSLDDGSVYIDHVRTYRLLDQTAGGDIPNPKPSEEEATTAEEGGQQGVSGACGCAASETSGWMPFARRRR